MRIAERWSVVRRYKVEAVIMMKPDVAGHAAFHVARARAPRPRSECSACHLCTPKFSNPSKQTFLVPATSTLRLLHIRRESLAVKMFRNNYDNDSVTL